MKKRHLLLCLFVMLASMTVSVFAGTGASRTDAIDFNLKLDPAISQPAGAFWYKVILSDLEADDAVDVTLSNQSDDEVNLSYSVYESEDALKPAVAGSKTLAFGEPVKISLPSGLKDFGFVFLFVQSDQNIAIHAEAVKTEPGVGCLHPVEMDYNAASKSWAAVKIDAFDTKVLQINGLQVLKNLGSEGDKVFGLRVFVKNLDDLNDANVDASISLSCGSPLQDISKVVPVNQQKSSSIKYSMVQQLKNNSVFVEVSTDADVEIWLEADPQDAVVKDGAASAVELKDKEPKEVEAGDAGQHWFKFNIEKAANMLQDSLMKIVYTNKSSKSIVVTENYKYTADDKTAMSEDKYTVPAGKSASHSYSPTQLKQLNAEWIYFYLSSTEKFDVEIRLEAADPGSICRTAISYELSDKTDDVLEIKHNTPNTVWYKLNYASALAINNGAVKVVIENESAADGTISADLKFDCDGAATPQTKAIKAGQKMSKTIGHALLESFTGSEVYIGLSSDVALKVTAQLVLEALSEDRACLEHEDVAAPAVAGDSKSFNFTTAKLDTAWYLLNIKDIKNAADPLDLKIDVTTDEGTVKLDGAVAFSCPATSMQKKSLTFKDSYSKTIAFSQLQSVKDEIFVRIIGSNSVKVTLTAVGAKKLDTPIDLCNDASVIEADENLNKEVTAASQWFHLDVAKLRETLKTNRVWVLLTTEAQTFKAATSKVCNVEYELSYQSQSRGNVVNAATEITGDKLDLVGDADELWINILAEKKYTVVVNVQPIEAGADCAHAEVFEAGKLYTQAAGTEKWFRVKVAELEKLGKNGTLTLSNIDNAKTAVEGVVYNDCGGAQLGSKKLTLAPKDVKVKTAGLTGYPSEVVLLIKSAGQISYRLDLADELGEECGEAIPFDWTNGHTLAGGSQTWINVKFAGNVDVENGDKVTIFVQNLSTSANKVFGGVAYNCADGLSQTGSRTLAAGAQLSKEITSLIGGQDEVIVFVAPDAPVRIWAEVVKQEPLTEPINVCGKATPVTYNVWYDVKAGVEDQWFVVDVKDLKTNTMGNGVFRIKADNDVNFKAEVSYVCEIKYPMSSKTLAVKADKGYSRDVTRSDINGVNKDIVYIHVSADQDAQFIFEIQDLTGYDCEHAIAYVWGDVVEVPSFSTTWYKIPYVDIRNDENVGIKADVKELSGKDNKVIAEIWNSCDNFVKDENRTVSGGASKSKQIIHKDIEGLESGVTLGDTIFIKLSIEGALSFSAVPYAQVIDKIEPLLCEGATFEVHGKTFNVDDVMKLENKQISTKSSKDYEFHHGDNEILLIDVDTIAYFNGDTYVEAEKDDLKFDKLPYVVRRFVDPKADAPVLGDAQFITTGVDTEKALQAWNNGGDEDNVHAKLATTGTWSIVSNTSANLKVDGVDCQDFDENFDITLYEDKLIDGGDVLTCAATVDDKVDTTWIDKENNIFVVTITRYSPKALQSVANIELSLDPIYVGHKADGTVLNTVDEFNKAIKDAVDNWNNEAGNAKVADVPEVKLDDKSFTLKDECGNEKEVPVVTEERQVVRVVDLAGYGCEEKLDQTITALPLGTITYDSIHVDSTAVKVALAAPAISDLEINCGQPVDLTAAEEALRAALVTTDPSKAAVANDAPITWAIEGAALTDIFEGGKQVKVSYTVVDECNNTLTNNVTITVNNDPVITNVDAIYGFEFVKVINGGILAIDLNAVHAQFNVELKAADVHWFQVVNGAEVALGDGLYYEPQANSLAEFNDNMLNGEYFAKLDIDYVVASGTCSPTFETRHVQAVKASAPAVYIAPNAVSAGQMVTIYNLDGQEASIAIYDMMGNMVSMESVSGVYNYSFNAQNNSGYYVVKVINGERVESLKYVVK